METEARLKRRAQKAVRKGLEVDSTKLIEALETEKQTKLVTGNDRRNLRGRLATVIRQEEAKLGRKKVKASSRQKRVVADNTKLQPNPFAVQPTPLPIPNQVPAPILDAATIAAAKEEKKEALYLRYSKMNEEDFSKFGLQNLLKELDGIEGTTHYRSKGGFPKEWIDEARGKTDHPEAENKVDSFNLDSEEAKRRALFEKITGKKLPD